MTEALGQTLLAFSSVKLGEAGIHRWQSSGGEVPEDIPVGFRVAMVSVLLHEEFAKVFRHAAVSEVTLNCQNMLASKSMVR
jgi:hypothetical protein